MDRLKWEKTYLLLRRDEKLREKRIRMFDLDKGSRIAEFGCGDGINLRIMQRLGYIDLHGLDNSKELLGLASGIHTILADACNTGLPADYFDVIFIDGFLHHLYNHEDCFREMRRVLKSGGYLCFIEPRNSLVRKVLDMVTFSPLSNLARVLRNRRISLKEEYDVYSNWSKMQNRLAGYLDKYGFNVIFWKKGPIGMFVKCKLIK